MEQKHTSKKEPGIHVLGNTGAYLSGSQAAVTFTQSKNVLADADSDPFTVLKNKPKMPKVVPWGEDNDIPSTIIEKIYGNPVTSSGMLFNIAATYGQGISVGKFVDGKFQLVKDNKQVNEFFEENDIQGYFLEQVTDINFFYNVYPEIILNKESNPKIVELNHKEAAFSRWGEMNKNGVIDWHYYSAAWSSEKNTPDDSNTDPTPVLNRKRPLADLRERVKSNSSDKRFIIPVCFPTPGRFYYQKPYWYSIIESGWYEFAKQIPEFKKALMKNQMSIKYHVELSEDYFPKIFNEEGITKDSDKKARIKAEFKNINDYLTDTTNTGKSVISYMKKYPNGGKMEHSSLMKITAIENEFKGGEYLEDSEEASNILSYGLGVHPSIIGSSPGKNKNINGTEARELFIIKQALLKPIRDRLLAPLYLIKHFNGWDPELHFVIPDITLTTLDENKTGQKTTINNA